MKHLRMMVVATAGLCVSLATSVFTAGPTFRADYRFSGTAWRRSSRSARRTGRCRTARSSARPKDANGGWLLVDGKEFQDTQMYASVKCVGGCKAGFLMRAEKTPDGGMKGVLMSVTEDDLRAYIVKMDATGKEISREPLPAPAGRAGGGRGAGGAAAHRWRGGRRAAGGARPVAAPHRQPPTTRPRAWLPPRRPWADVRRIAGPPPPMSPELAAQYPKDSRLAARPAGAFMPGDYNAVEVLLTENSVQPKFNGGSLGGGSGRRSIPDADKDGYGQIGLYVGGTGEARFKDFMYKDILNHAGGPTRAARTSSRSASIRTTTRGAPPSPTSTTTATWTSPPAPSTTSDPTTSRQADLHAGLVQPDGGMADSGDGQPRLRLHRRRLARCARR